MFRVLRRLNAGWVAHIGALVGYPLVWSNRFAAKWRLLWSLLSGPNILITCSHSKISNYTFSSPANSTSECSYYNVNEKYPVRLQRIDMIISMNTTMVSDDNLAIVWFIHNLCVEQEIKFVPPSFSFSDLYVNAVLGLMWTGVNIHGGWISISASKIMIQCNMNKTHFSLLGYNDHANFWFPNRFNSSDCSLFRKWHCSDPYTLTLIQWLEALANDKYLLLLESRIT